MGADYIWAHCEIPDRFVTRTCRVDVEAVTTYLAGVVAGLPADEAEAIAEFGGWVDIDGDEAEITARQHLEGLVTEFGECFIGRSCDVAEIGGVTFIHSGEHSWGDTPDEMYAIWAAASLFDYAQRNS